MKIYPTNKDGVSFKKIIYDVYKLYIYDLYETSYNGCYSATNTYSGHTLYVVLPECKCLWRTLKHFTTYLDVLLPTQQPAYVAVALLHTVTV
jgi:hypothetical protein